MPHIPEQNHSSHENLYEADENEQQLEDEIDAVALWQPDGGIVINARFAGANGGQDVVELRIDKDGSKQAIIDGQPADEDQIVKLGDVLGINLSGDVDPNDIEVRDDSPLQDSLNQERMTIEQQAKTDLREGGIDVDDNELLERRTEQPETNDIHGQQEVGTSTRERRQQGEDGILAEHLISKDAERTRALADALRAAGDPTKAARLERDAYEARKRVGGVKSVANGDPVIVDFSKRAREAMALTGKSTDDLEKDAHNDKKAA